MKKDETIKYLKRVITKLEKELDDDYCDKTGTLSNIQTLRNTILVLKSNQGLKYAPFLMRPQGCPKSAKTQRENGGML